MPATTEPDILSLNHGFHTVVFLYDPFPEGHSRQAKMGYNIRYEHYNINLNAAYNIGGYVNPVSSECKRS